MKALIIVTVLAMATSAIAVPLSRQAKAQALVTAMQDNAEFSLGNLFKSGIKYALMGDLRNGGGDLEENENEDAQTQSLLKLKKSVIQGTKKAEFANNAIRYWLNLAAAGK